MDFPIVLLIFSALFTSRTLSVLKSPYTLSRIKLAIERYEEGNGQVVIITELPPSNPSNLRGEDYISPDIIGWDVLKSYEHLLGDGLICHLCSDVLVRRSGRWTDGENDSKYPARVVYDTSSYMLLVSAIYVCHRGHQVPSHHPSILARLPSVYIPFYLTSRSGFTSSLLSQICSLVDHGVSFLGIEEIVSNQYKHCYSVLKQRFLHDSSSNIDAYFPLFEQSVFPFPHEKSIKDVFLSFSSLFVDQYHDDLAKRTSEWLCCDHTFKSAANIGYSRDSDARWIKLFKCVFCVLGKEGKVLHWKFTHGESFDEVRSVFEGLKKRYEKKHYVLKGIIIDNCCKWKGMLSSIFPGVPVKLDLFHAVQRLSKTLSVAIRMNTRIMKQYGLVFRDPSDLGETRLKDTPDVNTILNNLDSFVAKWQNSTWKNCKVFGSDSSKAVANIRLHIEKGCLSGIPAHCSTSGNERLHRNMNSIFSTNKIGVDLAYHRCSRLFYKSNNLHSKDFISLFVPQSKEGPYEEHNQNFGLPQHALFEKHMDSYPTGQLTSCLSIKNLIPDKISLVRSIITESIVPVLDSDHSYSAAKSSILPVALQALALFQIYQGLFEVGGERFISKSQFASSIGLGTVGAENMKHLMLPKSNGENELSLHENYLHSHLNNFGLSLVRVDGDGNCFFYTVAFQISNLISSLGTNDELIAFLLNLGISGGMTILEIAELLRKLIVDEWLGENSKEYQAFLEGFSNEEFVREATNYLRSQHFGGPLGDLMPVAMSNVLNIPLAIVTSEFHTPLITVCPQHVLASQPLFLAYNSFGAGHYDAAVCNQPVSKGACIKLMCNNTVGMGYGSVLETSSPSNRHTQETETSFSPSNCRCGSTKKKTSPNKVKRSVRLRCKCMLMHGKCNSSCKYIGLCGGKQCKRYSPASEMGRKSKRIPHILQKPKREVLSKVKMEFGSKMLNLVEICFICAIIQYLRTFQMVYAAKDVHSMYNELIDSLLDLGISLPLNRHDILVIEIQIKKILEEY